MTTKVTEGQIPDTIAEQIILAEHHGDRSAVFEAYRWLRENCPLGVVEVEDYDPLWLVSKYADIVEIERQPNIFSNCGTIPGTHNPILQTRAGDEYQAQLRGGTLRMMDSLIYMDPPEHGEVRSVAAEWFRPKSLNQWEDVIRVLARENIANRLGEGLHEIDFVTDFATYFPLQVIMKLFGIPVTDEALMRKLTQDLFAAADPDDYRQGVDPAQRDAASRQLNAVVAEFFEYFSALIDARRANPTDDLSGLIASARRESGELFDKSFAFGWYLAISTAGHDTTSITLSGTIEQLALQPDLLRRVAEDPSLIPSLVEEGLRWVSPQKHFMRQATVDYELRGQTIKKNDRVMLLYQSANRDADEFSEPDRFSIDRTTKRHLAFGTGAHSCIGLYLAKLELRVMLEELLPLISELTVIGPPVEAKAILVGGLRSLPVRIGMRSLDNASANGGSESGVSARR